MRGLVKETSKGWVVGFMAKTDPRPTSDKFEIVYLPLHPDDVPHAVNNTRVSFEVQTIAQGTSEFDILDADVARITKWEKKS